MKADHTINMRAMAELMTERDEARAEIDRMKESRDGWRKQSAFHGEKALEYMIERNEARAQTTKTMPFVEAVAKWEAEHGTLAAILPHEYEAFCKAMAEVAFYHPARAIVSSIRTAAMDDLIAGDADVVDLAPGQEKG